MAKKILLLSLLVAASVSLKAQQIETFPSARSLSNSISLYNQGNYAGSMVGLERYLQAYGADATEAEKAEAYYYLAAIQARLQGGLADDLLKTYLENYPETVNRDRALIAIGAICLSKQEYERASYYLSMARPEGLTHDERAECQVRLAYALLRQTKDGTLTMPKVDTQRSIERLLSEVATGRTAWAMQARLYMAQLQYLQGKYDQAEQTLGSTQGNETADEVDALTAQIAFSRGKYAETTNHVEALLRKNPSMNMRPVVLRIAGLSYYALQDYPNAIRRLSSYRLLGMTEKEDPTAALALGAAYSQTSDYTSAAEALLYATKDPDPAQAALANLYLGQAQIKLDRIADAILAFEAASTIKTAPELIREAATYNHVLALHQSGASGFGQSVRIAEQFFADFPSSHYRESVGKMLSEAYYNSKDYQTSLQSVERIKHPTKEILAAKQYVLCRLAGLRTQAGQLNDAEAYYTSAISVGDLGAYYAEALLGRAHLRLQSDKYAPAAIDASTYIARTQRLGGSEQLQSARYILAYSLFNQKQYAAAYKAFADYVGAASADDLSIADARTRMADCLYAQRRFEDAIDMYKRVAMWEGSPATQALYRLAEIYGLQGAYTQQMATIDQLLSKDPDGQYVPELLYERGRAAILHNESVSVAIKPLSEVATKYPDSRWARLASLEMAMLYYRKGQSDAAIKGYKNVIGRYPQSDEARSALNDLRTIYLELDRVEEYTAYTATLGAGYTEDMGETAKLLFTQAENRVINGSPMAAQAVRDYLERYPAGADAPRAQYYLAQIEEKAGNREEALRLYQQAASTSVPAETRMEALYRLGAIRESLSDFAIAYANYAAATQLAEDAADQTDFASAAIRAAYKAGKYKEVMEMVKNYPALVSAPSAELYIAKTHQALANKTEAIKIFERLSKDTDTEVGAEAIVMLATIKLEEGQVAEARKISEAFIKRSTPHQYWLARGFIVLSDSYAQNGEKIKAKQYLQSLIQNYKGAEPDIQQMIQERLAKLN